MKYLFRITTKKTDVWSNRTPKPIYFVAESKEEAQRWATANVVDGLVVSKITRLAEQVGNFVFTGL